MNADIDQGLIATRERLKELLSRAERDSMNSLAAAHLGGLPKGRRKQWTGYLDNRTRLHKGQLIILPDGRVAEVCAALRGKVGVLWNDPLTVTGQCSGLFKTHELKLYRLPAAVLLGRLKRGVTERKSERKAQSCRRNACKPPRPGSRPRGRPRKNHAESPVERNEAKPSKSRCLAGGSQA